MQFRSFFHPRTLLERVAPGVLALSLGCGPSAAPAAPTCVPGEPSSVRFERSPSGAREVDPQWLAEHQCAVRIVDLRGDEELRGPLGRIAGAEHVPLEQLEEHAAQWSTGAPMVLVDRSGRRALRAQEHLEALGFAQVASLTGGMLAWHAAALPVAHPPPSSVAPRAVDEPRRDDVDAAIATHLGAHVRWMRVAELMTDGTQACIDGRDESPVVGTPGGDAGELVLALAALEHTARRPIDATQVPAIFDAYVASFGRFYLHSDVHAIERLGALLRADPRFAPVHAQLVDARAIEALVRHPPVAIEGALLEHLTAPAAVGCGHLRLMLEHPEEYGARRELTEAVLRAAFRRGWERPELLRFVVLEGEHEESAVVRVHLEHEVHAYTRVPAFAPHAEGSALFVAHPEVSRYVRHENGAFMIEHRAELVGAAVEPGRYLEVLDTLADRQVRATLSHLAPDLPVYEVSFHGETAEVRGPAIEH